MPNYAERIKETSDSIGNKAKKNVLAVAYLFIWLFSLLIFWFFTDGSDAFAYSVVFLWGILPISEFVISLLIGKNNFWGKIKWLAPLVFGIMQMSAEYGTFAVANTVANSFTKINTPDLGQAIIGATVSAIGLGIGILIARKKSKRK